MQFNRFNNRLCLCASCGQWFHLDGALTMVSHAYILFDLTIVLCLCSGNRVFVEHF